MRTLSLFLSTVVTRLEAVTHISLCFGAVPYHRTTEQLVFILRMFWPSYLITGMKNNYINNIEISNLALFADVSQTEETETVS